MKVDLDRLHQGTARELIDLALQAAGEGDHNAFWLVVGALTMKVNVEYPEAADAFWEAAHVEPRQLPESHPGAAGAAGRDRESGGTLMKCKSTNVTPTKLPIKDVEHAVLVTHACVKDEHSHEERCECGCGHKWVKNYK